MTKLLIFNGAPEAAQQRLGRLGGPSNSAMIETALKMHLGAQGRLETFTLNVADGERLPQGLALEDFDGAWISGSPLNVYQLDQPSVRAQIELAREIFHRGTPTFGSCWGLQVMTAALGGVVRLNPNGREFGIARNITLNEDGRAHAMFRDKASAFDALCSHEDEVEALPACGRLLAGNDVSRVQAAEMVEGHKCFWGVQYHPEHVFAYTAAILEARMMRGLHDDIVASDADVKSIAQDFRALGAAPGRKDLAWKYGATADVLDPVRRTLEFRNWLETKVLAHAAARS